MRLGFATTVAQSVRHADHCPRTQSEEPQATRCPRSERTETQLIEHELVQMQTVQAQPVEKVPHRGHQYLGPTEQLQVVVRTILRQHRSTVATAPWPCSHPLPRAAGICCMLATIPASPAEKKVETAMCSSSSLAVCVWLLVTPHSDFGQLLHAYAHVSTT